MHAAAVIAAVSDSPTLLRAVPLIKVLFYVGTITHLYGVQLF